MEERRGCYSSRGGEMVSGKEDAWGCLDSVKMGAFFRNGRYQGLLKQQGMTGLMEQCRWGPTVSTSQVGLYGVQCFAQSGS